MKKFFGEFKEFISRGSVIDLAVGIIIGGAFTAIVTSLVNDIIMPLISLIFGGMDFTKWNIVIGQGEEPAVLAIGTFIAAIINFIIVALVIFSLVRTINKIREKAAKKEAEEKAAEEPTTKVCPFCKSEISIEASRCPHCTSVLEEK